MSPIEPRNDGHILVVATSNEGKLRELSAILPPSTSLLTLRDIELDSPEETGRTFLDNAMLKAQYASEMSGYPAIADDSGLTVDTLDGRPGVYSARFAGPDASDDENNAALIEELRLQPSEVHAASFRCAVAFCAPDGHTVTAEGELRGKIVELARGSNGFGYDPHFEIHDPDARKLSGRTVAELTLEEKNEISHRARAYRNLITKIRQLKHDHPANALLILE